MPVFLVPEIPVAFGAKQEDYEGKDIYAGGGGAASEGGGNGYGPAGRCGLSKRGSGGPGVLYLNGAGADF